MMRRPRPGDTVDDRYLITDVRAERGESTVCCGVDSQVGARVLVKAAPTDSPAAFGLAREQAVLRHLGGAAVPEILDFGEDAAGTTMLILTDPGGISLSEAWKRSAGDERARLLLISAVCRTLEAVHDNDILWVCLDPESIQIDGKGRAWLTDASFATNLNHGALELSATGEAPELVRAPEQADPSADVCAMGVMWFSLLLGRPLAPGDFADGGEVYQPQQYFPGILPAANSIIVRAMCAERRRRYAAIGLMNEAIGQALESLDEPEMPGVGICSDTGLVRAANEDSHAVVCFGLGRLYILADGMGGEAGGVVASRLTVSVVRDYLSSALAALPAELASEDASATVQPYLQEAVNLACAAVFDKAGQEPHLRRMGSTVVIAVQFGDYLYVANVGDSRAYLLGAAGADRLTQDHTAIAQLVARGDLAPEQASQHPARGQLTRNIGGRPRAEAHLSTRRLQAGDFVLLCCDGLTDMVSEVEIYTVVRGAPGPGEAARSLVNLANARGGFDNVSVIVVEHGGGAR